MLDIPTLEAIKYLLIINTMVVIVSTILITNALYDIKGKGLTNPFSFGIIKGRFRPTILPYMEQKVNRQFTQFYT